MTSKQEQVLQKMYYSPRGYWKGEGAVKKLSNHTGFSKEIVRRWLRKQAIWQIYQPAPAYIPRPTSLNRNVGLPNEMHQADLLYLPHDSVKKRTYKYALTVVDVATRYKEAEPLTAKTSDQVVEAIKKIYKRSALSWPKILKVDPGKEFMSSFSALMKSKKVQLQKGEVGNHRAQGIVERFNRTLAERLFGHQYAIEMLNPTERSRLWVARLPEVIKALNDEETRLISTMDGKPLTPRQAMSQLEVRQISSAPSHVEPDKRTQLSVGAGIRYLYQPGEVEKDSRRRATDPIWSVDIFFIDRVVATPGQPALYYLKDGASPAPPRSFVKQELMVIPDDTELGAKVARASAQVSTS